MAIYKRSREVELGATKNNIKNISRNIGAVFFKLGTRNVHHKRNRVTYYVVTMATLLAPVSFCEQIKYRNLQHLQVGQKVLLGTHMVHILS